MALITDLGKKNMNLKHFGNINLKSTVSPPTGNGIFNFTSYFFLYLIPSD